MATPIANRVCVVGGTHGNEITGVNLLAHWQAQRLVEQFESLDLKFLLANPRAVKDNKRYIDVDLNRCFRLQDLNNPNLPGYERSRACEINKLLGPKGRAKTDFIIDLHTSTANMRTNIVLIKHDAFHLQLAAHLQRVLPDVVVTSEAELMPDHHFLCSIAERGLVIEVGPVAQGALDFRVLKATQDATLACLDFYQRWIRGETFACEGELEVMSYFDKVYFPRDDRGHMTACIAPELLYQDYAPINPGDPLFVDFAGKPMAYEGEPAHLAFINEAAYYDQGIAACLCRPKKLPLTPLESPWQKQ